MVHRPRPGGRCVEEPRDVHDFDITLHVWGREHPALSHHEAGHGREKSESAHTVGIRQAQR
eukprot:352044-Chlamydomonas_euryale.AAC.4